MQILIIFFGIFLSFGIFFILLDVLKLPSLKSSKALLFATKQSYKKAYSIEVFINSLASKIAPFIPLDEYKKIRMKNTLKASEIYKTPEQYTAYALVKSTLVALLSLPCFLILPIIAPVVLLLAISIYFKEIRQAYKKLSVKRELVERELPRFVATINEELKASRDVLTILENYKKSASRDFARELDIVTADMRLSSYELALTRFEARLNSPMLSDIIRGLIAVIRGDNATMYFSMLSHDLKQLELQNLKAKALKIPPKIRVYSFLMLMCFITMYIVVIVSEILRYLTGMF